MTPTTDAQIPSRPYRPCVGLAIFNAAGQVFIGERLDMTGAWQMPQGGIDPGESLLDAAFREMEEEVGTRKAALLEIMPEKTRYTFPQDLSEKLWEGKYGGQEQTWIALRFTGEDSDIDIAASDHAEFRRWKWCVLSDLPGLAVPFKRETYEIVMQAFSKYA